MSTVSLFLSNSSMFQNDILTSVSSYDHPTASYLYRKLSLSNYTNLQLHPYPTTLPSLSNYTNPNLHPYPTTLIHISIPIQLH